MADIRCKPSISVKNYSEKSTLIRDDDITDVNLNGSCLYQINVLLKDILDERNNYFSYGVPPMFINDF